MDAKISPELAIMRPVVEISPRVLPNVNEQKEQKIGRKMNLFTKCTLSARENPRKKARRNHRDGDDDT